MHHRGLKICIRLSAASVAVFSVFSLATSGLRAEESISFNRDIRPLLSQNCYSCHGPDEESREAGLRLDVREEAIQKDRKGHAAIVPGDPEASLIMERIFSEDPDEIMPPPESGRELTLAQKQTLSRWIQSGAGYEQHWAFVPPVKAPAPEIESATDWPRNELDLFILAKMQDADLEPSPMADLETLYRRVSLDLTGLPPSPDELERALAVKDPMAYERWVDQLLQRPEFGERWASVWLDLARYADSAGYGSDPLRNIWRYRDWVIQAINSNLPFDEFTIQQLAGDLLQDATTDQILATAFHRNTKTNTEGGTDDEEFRVEAVRDRINTTMQVWMGLTFGCAQCHTHKYDPISHKEYYQMYGYFNQTADNDRPSEAPLLTTPTPDNLRQLAKLQQAVQEAESFYQEENGDWRRWQQQWETLMRSTGKTGGFTLTPWRSSGWKKYDSFDAAFKSELADLSDPAELSDVSDLPALPDLSDSAILLTRSLHSYTTRPVEFSLGSDDGVQFWLNGARLLSKKVRRAAEPDQEKVRGMLRPGDNTLQLKIINGDGESGYFFRVASTWPEGEIGELLEQEPDQLDNDQLAKLRKYYRSISPALRPEQQQLAEQEKAVRDYENSMPKTPIMEELPEDKRRETFIMVQGSFLNPGDAVEPQTLSAFHPFPEGEPNNRLGFAKWLVDRRNPLTARVTVNRFWARLFGEGIVSTEEDFGSQGELPTHPELLDWMAVDFMESGWDVKALLKKMVTSATYMQTSRVTDEALGLDPDNRYYARAPRFRLPAEALRDQALYLAGLLTPKMYGPSVFPPQPPNMWQAAFNGQRNWATDTNEDRFRRGVYVFLRRTVPYPGLATFDAPSREVCSLRRVRTNTPLQAFVTLNDPGFFEAAQGLAKRILRETEGTLNQRLAEGYRWVTGTDASSEQLQTLSDLYKTELDWYSSRPEEAKSLNKSPLTGPDPEGYSEAELAAWSVVTNVLLNMDRFFMKG